MFNSVDVSASQKLEECLFVRQIFAVLRENIWYEKLRLCKRLT